MPVIATVLLALETGISDVADGLGDALVPIGGAALVLACIRMAVSAYKDSAATAREREKTCTDALAIAVTANTALATEVRANHQDVQRGIGEILAHIQNGKRG